MTDGAVLAARCDSLRDAWAWWAEVLGSLRDDDWPRPTRLEGWDVAALVAHHAFLVHGLAHLAANPVDASPVIESAAGMLRRFNAPDGVAHTLAPTVADTARRAASTASREQLIATFADLAPQAVTAVRRAGPIVVDYFGHGPLPVAEALSIFVMEAVVHGLDLAAALARGEALPRLPTSALELTAELLATVAPPVPFIEAATGRAPAAAVLPIIR